MKKRSLSVKKKIHNFYLKSLQNKKIKKTYKIFEKNLSRYNFNKICIAISGGVDSMALLFLLKCYTVNKKIKIYCCTVDHRLRKESSIEAKKIKEFLRKYNIFCEILTNKKKEIKSNIQSEARNLRYDLIYNFCQKNNLKFILTGHNKNDLYENFFIRLLRGSGLRGLSSFYSVSSNPNFKKPITVLRPLLSIDKNDLSFITKETFGMYFEDPSNTNEKFLRVKIRKMLKQLFDEGLDLRKFNKTLQNLNYSSKTIDYFISLNIKSNVVYKRSKNMFVLNHSFFDNPNEVISHSFNRLFLELNNKNNFTRSKKIDLLINNLKTSTHDQKFTLSGCIIEKVNKTVLIYKEN